MKNLITLTVSLLITGSLNALVFNPPSDKVGFEPSSDATISKTVAIAINDGFPNLLESNNGHSVCQPVINPLLFNPQAERLSPTDFEASGKNQEMARTLSQMKCIRAACGLLPDAVNEEAVKLSKDEQRMRQILVESGFTEEQIQQIMKKPRSANNNKLSCSTSMNMQTLAYDSCVTVPYQCN